MSETTPPTDSSATDPAKPAPKKKRKLWKLLLGGVVVIVLLLGLLVLLAPMIISTGAVRGMVVSKVNENLNGKVEIQNWNITWTGGVKVEGIRVFDASNAQIAEVKSLSTQLSLLDAAKGHLALGETIVDSPSANLVVYEDGTTNFSKLPKTDSSTKSPGQPRSEPAQPSGESKPLDISGNFKVISGRATVEQKGQPTLHVTSFNANADVKSLNDPIDHSLDVDLRVQDKNAGKVALKGTASLKDMDVKNLNVNDTLTLSGIDLEGLKALVPASAGVDLNKGVTNGSITVVVVDGKSATLSGQIDGSGYVMAGKALKGDTFRTEKLTIVIPPTVVAMPNGPTDSSVMTVKTGGEKPAPISVTWDQGSVTASADAALAALMNLAANRPPGSAGSVNVGADINVAALAKMLPTLFSIPKNVDLKTGKLEEKIALAITPEQAAFSVITDIKNITGTNDGKDVKLKDINVTLKGNARGSAQAMPDLRDLKLDLTSGFATANFTAPTLTQLGGKAEADLAKLQAELGQIVDFQGKTLAGTFVMNVSTQGDPQKLSTPAPADVKIQLTGVEVKGVARDPIKVENLLATVKSTLNATDAGALQSIDNTVITVKNLKGQDATIDALIDGIKVTLGDTMTANFNVSKLALNVEKLQDDLKPFVEALQKGGRLDMGVINVALTGVVTQTTDTLTAKLSNLSVTETKGLFSLTQPKDGVIDVKQVTIKDAPPVLQASGKVDIAADLKRGQAVAKAFQVQTSVNGKQPEVVSGKLNGTVEAATLDQKSLKLAGKFDINDLSIDTGHGETARQQITLALASTAASDFTSVRDTSVNFTGPFGDVKLENASVDLPPALPEGSKGTALPVVKSAKLTVDIKDMGPLDSLRSALAPAAPPPATQPVRVPRGAMKLAADVKQVGQEIILQVTELSGTDELRLQQGDGIYKVKPFNNKDPLLVKVALSGNSQQPLEEQIKLISVNTLNLDLGVLTLKSDKGLFITNPLGKEPVPSGNVALATKIQNLTEIPEMLAKKKKGELYPYEGDLLLTQEFKKNGDNLAVDGNIGVTNLKVFQDGKPVVDEPQVTIANNILADLAKKNLTITKVLVDMPKSQALNVTVTGAINDWANKRQFNDLLVTLAGDWAKLWTIVHPMMGKDANGKDPYEDLVVTGTFKDRKITVGGSMPAGVEGPAATRLVTAQGSIGIEKLVWPSYGITSASNIEVPFTLKENLLTTAIPGQTYTPIQVNGGTVDISNIRYAIADPPKLYIDPQKQVVKGVSLTAALTEKMGAWFKNPFFLGTKESSGTLDLTIVECNGFVASGAALEKATTPTAPLKVMYSINDFRALNEFATLLMQLVNQDEDTSGGDLRGSIKDATVVLQSGEVQQDTTLVLAQRKTPLRLVGGIDLQSLEMKNFLMNLPPAMLKQVKVDKNTLKYLPAGIDIPMRGKVTALGLHSFHIDQNTILKLVREAGTKAVQDKFLGGGGKEPADPNAKPGDQKKPDDPIGGALDDLFNKKKKDDKKKK